MKSVIVLILLAFVFYLIASNNDDSQPSQPSPFTQTGYFKQAENRIVSVTMAGNPGGSEAKNWGRNFAYTPGHFTAVYFFDPGSTVAADGLTEAKNVFTANNVLYDIPGLSKWHYAYMRSMNGTQKFIDCHKDTSSSLCRQ